MTINEMLIKTLHTSINRKPTYRDALEKLGYDLCGDGFFTDRDTWTVRFTDVTGHKYTIGCNRADGKRCIRATGKFVCFCEHEDSLDLVNYIKTH